MREYLKAMRGEKGFKQTTLAETIGISQSYYCMIEGGDRQQDMVLSIMEKLSGALEVPLQKIVESETAYKAERRNTA